MVAALLCTAVEAEPPIYPIGRAGTAAAGQDRWTTYCGGQGFYTSGLGVQAAIDTGSLIAPLQRAGITSSVPAYVLAGSAADLPGVLDENRGPGDGIVFTASALDTTGIGTVGGSRHLRINRQPSRPP